MDEGDPRAVLERLIHERGEDCASLSRLIGRNPAYVQQFIRRGSPRRLAEADRQRLARYFGIPETWLGAPATPRGATAPAMLTVPVLDTAASAGPGAVGEDRLSAAGMGFSEEWLRRLRPGGGREGLSVIRVTGDSMLPTMADGDEILVDRRDAHGRLRDGIYVLRVDGVLLVKRLVREGEGFAVRSDNPAAGPVDLAGGVDVIGRVLWAGRRL
ncbi:MAG TPA: S24 family peptidase [Sphingomonas sp.]|nr:S24 family peptidase [Sphingomonas sp.]